MKTSDNVDHTPARVDRRATVVDHRATVAAETARFVTVVRDADLATPVPGCPGWTLADLIKHTGSVQRWFAALLRARIQEPPRSREVDLHLPDQEDGYADWLAESATVAADAFAATGPNLPMWAWGADQHARFWARRMLFETLLHRADAELALGLRPAIDRAVAVDGIDEFLVNLPFAAFFAPHVVNLRAPDRTIRFRATDGDGDGNGNGDGDWLVHLRSDGFALATADAEAATADATVRGAARDLLLLVYGRLHHDDAVLSHEGDEGLLTHWFANSAF
ncbi:maleylpyruvate isomerase family mycothiol-dependent enzyme [Streptomyces durmitorensis]|uniref:Maleylpyruvate isomerase family mycothiol-dependent enzyme n=1 Tax=Streptomyces durmitorensis TaxID=319947 RepID=A0ABY4PM82_9ACTN|nr:maleylpyruvate isomerase family mycothiol-dependent enzyme [Streptomyces durmitorensis]UQT54915.1 maleylpyruvate isomerase family mycothiol-dependent enzyme [Streptomyces durmitorensis]